MFISQVLRFHYRSKCCERKAMTLLDVLKQMKNNFVPTHRSQYADALTRKLETFMQLWLAFGNVCNLMATYISLSSHMGF
jgi:hypothetical protein